MTRLRRMDAGALVRLSVVFGVAVGGPLTWFGYFGG
jgi:hypothetical protein